MKFWQVDAFTKTPFKGNPAAVFILEKNISDEQMLNIAIEMNLSETAFILLRENKPPFLRWFTPMFEIDLCGHATLSAAHVLFDNVFCNTSTITFDTKFVGQLEVSKKDDFYHMNFPSRGGHRVDVSDIPDFVLNALSEQKPIDAYQSRDLMLVYENEKIIHDIEPDFNALANYDNFIAVTAASNNHKYDFVSRFFCASDAIAEDPVTGSAHCTLAPFWFEKLNKKKLIAYQASKRGGELILDKVDNRVLISGQAVTVAKGSLTFKLD